MTQLVIQKVNVDKMMDILLEIKKRGYEYASITIEDRPEHHVIHINPSVAKPAPGETFNPEFSI